MEVGNGNSWGVWMLSEGMISKCGGREIKWLGSVEVRKGNGWEQWTWGRGKGIIRMFGSREMKGLGSVEVRKWNDQ